MVDIDPGVHLREQSASLQSREVVLGHSSRDGLSARDHAGLEGEHVRKAFHGEETPMLECLPQAPIRGLWTVLRWIGFIR